MPLPCSPVSHSAPSETQSSVPHSEDSDDSLTTPRAGPADPAQRTHANLSRPSLPPPVSGSPESVRELPQAGKASRRSSGSSGRRVEGLGLGTASPARSTSPPATRSSTTEKRDTPFETQTEGHPSEPYASGSSPRKPAPAFGTEKPQPSERGSTVSFTALTSHPRAKRQGSYNNPAMSRLTPSESPHAATRRPYDDLESSADEGTAIFKRVSPRDYGATGGDVRQPNGADDVAAAGYEGAAEEDGPRRRKTVGVKVRSGNGTSANADQADGAPGRDASEEHEAWWKRMVEKYGSVELENKGSVARDHLALERTFLAWLRTSLAFASIGVAVTQLFRLNTSLQNAEKEVDTSSLSMFELLLSNAEPQQKLRHVGKPLGATFLGISILILLLGFHRYFESQHYVIRGKFPASRGSIFLVSLLTFALIVASLVVVLTVAPGAFERR